MWARISLSTLWWSGLGAAGAAAGGYALARGTWLWPLFGAFAAACLMRLAQLQAARRRFLERLAAACARLGEADFLRPCDDRVGDAYDRVAAALAVRHGAFASARGDARRAEEALLAALKAAPDPFILVARDGRVERINEAACNTFAVAPEQAVGRPFLHAVHSHLVAEALNECLRTGEGADFEVDIRLGQAPTRFAVRIEPIPPAPVGTGGAEAKGAGGAAVVLHDVTRLRHLEKVRKEFVANLSHELRTPITSIKGFVETLLEEDLPPQTRSRFLNILKHEVDRLHALVGDLLSLSLLESDTTALRLSPVDVAELVRNVFTLFEPQAREARVTLKYSAPEDLPPLPAHPGMLEQALVNLVDNAIKYSPPGSTVTVEARRIAGDHLEIAVVDNGPGIPSEHLSRLFERFYRVDKARSKSMGGTGLGLAIVRHIVRRHGGAVRAESRLGKGSRFIITLPLTPQEVAVPDWDD